jgi:hypothetical protein
MFLFGLVGLVVFARAGASPAPAPGVVEQQPVMDRAPALPDAAPEPLRTQ